MANSSWQGTNATVWYVASALFFIAAIASFLNDQTVYGFASVAIAFSFIAIAGSIKKNRSL